MLKVVPLTDVAVWESEWINVLLAEFPEVKWLPYNAQVPMKDYALYVYNSDSALSLSPEILSGITKLKGAGLLHLGDEYLRSSLLDYAHFSYVVRMYSFSKTVTPGVLTIPIGPTPKLGPASSKPASRRKHTWMFAGDWKSDRSAMADQFTTWDKGLFSMPMPYNDAERLSRQDYLTGMSETAFAPCPAGNIVLETCRPYEALHFGAIPLLPRRKRMDPYRSLFCDHPLPTFENWKSAYRFARELYAKPDEMDALQTKCINWWQSTKSELATNVKSFIEDGQAGTFRKALQERFSGQAIGKIDRARELLAHQNRYQFQSRIAFRAKKAARFLSGSGTAKPTWSLVQDDTEKPTEP